MYLVEAAVGQMSVAVQQQMVSGREEELGEIFRTMLEWNNYAVGVVTRRGPCIQLYSSSRLL